MNIKDETATMTCHIPKMYIIHRHETYDVKTPPRTNPNAAPTGFPAEKAAKTLFLRRPGP
jgi:hypothetical protein